MNDFTIRLPMTSTLLAGILVLCVVIVPLLGYIAKLLKDHTEWSQEYWMWVDDDMPDGVDGSAEVDHSEDWKKVK